MNPKVDFYFNKANRWQSALEQLRKIVLECELSEELKWGVPCYTYQKHNIILIHVFKEYCAILFIKGALLNDSHGVLIQQTENTQAARQIRFTSIQEIVEMKTILKTYIYEAIEVERTGLKVELKKPEEFNISEEFQKKLDEIPALKTAFEALTPSRQRAYLLHFSTPNKPNSRFTGFNLYSANYEWKRIE